jgi:hypothetical protein
MPSRNDIEGVRAQDLLVYSKMKLGTGFMTLGANLTLDADSPTIMTIDPTAARDLVLPAEADSVGLMFVILNAADAAEDITVKDDGAATIGTISQNEIGILFCNGVAWRLCVGKTT